MECKHVTVLSIVLLFCSGFATATTTWETQNIPAETRPAIFIPATVPGDTLPIRGYLRKSNGDSSFAFISLDGQRQSTVHANPNGYFETVLPVDPGTHTVAVHGVGFREEYTVHVTEKPDQGQDGTGNRTVISWSGIQSTASTIFTDANRSVSITLNLSNTGAESRKTTVVAQGFFTGITFHTLEPGEQQTVQFNKSLPAAVNQSWTTFTLYVDGKRTRDANLSIKQGTAVQQDVEANESTAAEHRSIEKETAVHQKGDVVQAVHRFVTRHAAWILLAATLILIAVAVYHRLHKQPVRSRQRR